MIRADDTTSLSRLYHLNSEPWLNDAAYELAGGQEPLLDVARGPLLPLPPAGESALVELQRGRRSCRSFADRRMPLGTVASVLAGCQGTLHPTEESFLRRATPSAGGLFPLDLYVFARRVDGLVEGLHRYDGLRHALVELDRDGVSERLAAALYAYPFVVAANLVLALVARFDRMQDKYGPRGYRYILLEAGHCAQNVCLRAVELGVATLCVGGYGDAQLNALLGLSDAEGVVYVLAAGYAA